MIEIETKEIVQRPELIIRPQTQTEEFDYLWYILGKMPFYKEHGYTVGIPDHPTFRSIAENSDNTYIHTLDRTSLQVLFEEEIYDPSFFQPGVAALENVRPTIEAAFPKFIEFNRLWGFHIPEQYDLALTRYGPGGSYDPETGKITMFTTAEGTFKRPHPTMTPIHEMNHIGIERNIVEEYGLEHTEKERVIDLMCQTRFGDLLPGYQLQALGDSRIDPYVTESTLSNLPNSISEYVQRYPRT